jgi:hypothetical protein
MSDKPKPRHRDAESGQMVSKEYADANPSTTVSESKPVLTLADASMLIRGILKHYKIVTDGIEAGGRPSVRGRGCGRGCREESDIADF